MDKRKLPLSQVTPGMKLAEPIANASGVTLMPAGIRLTPMFIARIKKWNIETLHVLVEKKTEETSSESAQLVPPAGETPEKEEDGHDLSGEQLEFARAVASEVSSHFVNVRNNPLMMQLRVIVIKRLVLAGPGGLVNMLRRQSGRGMAANGEGV